MFPRFVSLAQAFAPNLTHVTYCLVNIPIRMSNGHLISNILINVLLIHPNLFFPLFSQYQWMQLHYFNCKAKNIGVTFDISLFSHPTANPLTNAVIIPLTYTENLTSSQLHYCHSSSSSFDPLTLRLWQNLWCYFLLCPYHSLESVLSTAITGMLNSPDHFGLCWNSQLSSQLSSADITRPCSDLPGTQGLPSPYLCDFPSTQPCFFCSSHTGHLPVPGSPQTFSCLQTRALTVSLAAQFP